MGREYPPEPVTRDPIDLALYIEFTRATHSLYLTPFTGPSRAAHAAVNAALYAPPAA